MHAQLRSMASELVVLYVEDEETTRERVAKTLSQVFTKVLVAKDGKEGLEFFDKNKIDITISDIQMPNMNGLEMSKAIKERDRANQIVITTAFSDERYLIDAIEIGIDRYVLKPIELDKLFAALSDVARVVIERRRLDELKRQEIAKRINQATSKVLLEAINLYPSPTLIYSHDGRVVAVNNSLVNLLGDRLERIADVENLSTVFVAKHGYLSDLSKMDSFDSTKNRVAIRTAGGTKVFLVDSQILGSEGDKPSIVYTLTDITRLEYEKQKAQNLSVYLRDLSKIRRKDRIVADGDKPVVAKLVEPVLSEEERNALVRSHVHKTTALEYVKEIDSDVLDELDELSEIDGELAGYIDSFEENPTNETLQPVAGRVEKYSITVAKLFEFEDLAFALEKLAKFLSQLDTSTINTRKLTLLLNSIRLDLVSWRDTIFVRKEAQDIHYLDSSLLSSCLQIEIDFGARETVESSENELDLF